ncbi:hypothetical protein KQX54_012195 [Cotesia glomerata]|uniref:Carboxylesterase type B domain-containing protein n=1 Tax=Cotesia glomerata TaxID=32391 RepID=A0AAV7ILJ5_COTGL|nr:hypothetical protein KQX54_012195 [Cotesia glomerata]
MGAILIFKIFPDSSMTSRYLVDGSSDSKTPTKQSGKCVWTLECRENVTVQLQRKKGEGEEEEGTERSRQSLSFKLLPKQQTKPRQFPQFSSFQMGAILIFKIFPDSSMTSRYLVDGSSDSKTPTKYTDWERPKDGYIYQKAIADIVGDYFFICPSTLFAQLFAERGMKVYYYFFTQRSSTNLWGEWMGVVHGDEVEYVFGHPLNTSLKYTDKERELSMKIISAFSNFAFTG